MAVDPLNWEAIQIWPWETAPSQYKELVLPRSQVNYVIRVPSHLVHWLGDLDPLTLDGDKGPSYATASSSLAYALDRLSQDEVLYHYLDDGTVVGLAYQYHSL